MKETCKTNPIYRNFVVWNKEYKLDHVSGIVLSSLLTQYINGNREPLFGKFKQLIDDEHYSLSVIFRDCLTKLGINDEFKEWYN